MKVIVTGATGFVGQHVVNQLIASGHTVVAVARDIKRATKMPWFENVDFIQCDLYEDFQPVLQNNFSPDVLVHLAWSGLPNYLDFFHISTNLMGDLAFLEAVVDSGISQLLVAGTCLEYGMQHGPLNEEMETRPTTSYGFAKDVLRKSLQVLQKEKPFILQWMRLFYMYGEGQNKNSLLAQLDRAIDEKTPVFNMSKGDQLRDYLSIQDVARNFVLVIENSQCDGMINCCSGAPVSVIDLVKKRCRYKNSNIQLNRGFYPYPNYETLAFWGESSKLMDLKSSLGMDQN